MTVRAVLFDLDGTLVDSLADLTDAVNYMLASFARPTLDAATLRRMLGAGARELVRQALASDSPAEIELGLGRFLEFNTSHIADKSRLYPGARNVLEQLAAKGIPMAAISNKNEALSRLILKELDIDYFFSAICGGDTLAEMKPSPLPLLHVLERLAIPPREAVMVGDSSYDILAGRRAGISTIGCSWGFGDFEELRDACHLAASCDELADILRSLDP